MPEKPESIPPDSTPSPLQGNADPDANASDPLVCLCFRVSQSKIVNYCRREQPPVASLISECLAAGTGCGWCVPYLKRLHQQVADGEANPSLPLDPQTYAEKRKAYRKSGER